MLEFTGKKDAVLQGIDAVFAASFTESWPIRPSKSVFSLIQVLRAVCGEYAELTDARHANVVSVKGLERERAVANARQLESQTAKTSLSGWWSGWRILSPARRKTLLEHFSHGHFITALAGDSKKERRSRTSFSREKVLQILNLVWPNSYYDGPAKMASTPIPPRRD